MKKEGEKYRETQVSRTGATCPIFYLILNTNIALIPERNKIE